MPRRAAKIDKNQPEIIEEFESHGCAVHSLAGVGDGFPDLIVWDGAVHHLVEVKSKTGKLTAKQELFHDKWPGRIYIIRDKPEVKMQVEIWRWSLGNEWPGEG